MFRSRLRAAANRHLANNRFTNAGIVYKSLADKTVIEQAKINGLTYARTNHARELEDATLSCIRMEEILDNKRQLYSEQHAQEVEMSALLQEQRKKKAEAEEIQKVNAKLAMRAQAASLRKRKRDANQAKSIPKKRMSKKKRLELEKGETNELDDNDDDEQLAHSTSSPSQVSGGKQAASLCKRKHRGKQTTSKKTNHNLKKLIDEQSEDSAHEDIQAQSENESDQEQEAKQENADEEQQEEEKEEEEEQEEEQLQPEEDQINHHQEEQEEQEDEMCRIKRSTGFEYASIGGPTPDDILTFRDLEATLDNKRKLLTQLEETCPEKQWKERVASLKHDDVASLPVLNFASGIRDNRCYAVDTYRHTCGKLYRFENVIYLNICELCRKCVDVLIAAEDTQVEITSIKAVCNAKKQAALGALDDMSLQLQNEDADDLRVSSTTFSSSTERPMLTTIPTTTTTTATTTTTKMMETKSTKQTVPRKPASIPKRNPRLSANAQRTELEEYVKYLLQFSSEAPRIPADIMRNLWEALASVHLFTAHRCKPLPISDILPAEYKSQKERISLLFNGEPVPVLTPPLITALAKRFSIAQVIVNENPSLYLKTLPKDIFTHHFLRSEHRTDLASAFATHKTTSFLQPIPQKCRMIFQACQTRAPEMTWVFE